MRADIDVEGIRTRCDGGEKEKRLKTIESDCLLAAASPSHADTRGRTGRAECQVDSEFHRRQRNRLGVYAAIKLKLMRDRSVRYYA
jgi:hypothetical protein